MNLRTHFTTTIISLFLLNVLSAQVSLTIDHGNQDNNAGTVDNTAIEEVNLLPNYDYEAQSDRIMNAYLDPTIIAPPSYGNLFSSSDFDNYQIDPDLEVGFTPGAHGVSPSGAATYTVPIQLPPGTNGMEPELAISYNSQAGNGLLGMGWNLAGLSQITRVTQSFFMDGAPRSIQFDNSDQFALDGNRLIFQAGQNGGNASYKTYLETHSRIISYELNDGNGVWFNVQLKSGITIEYGRTSDSQVRSDEGIIWDWKINKMYDPHGNYVEYQYLTVSNETRISQINYTGNFNFETGIITSEPYNSIHFYYQERDDQNERFLHGSSYKSIILLKKIRMLSKDVQFREYAFEYGLNNHSYLMSVQESGQNSIESLNPTIFQYSESGQVAFPESFNAPDSDFECFGSTFSTVVPVSDFNGDGIADIMRINKCYGPNSLDHDWEVLSSNWQILTKESIYSNDYTVYASGELDAGFILADNHYSFNLYNYLDFDGDGHQDLLRYTISTLPPHKCLDMSVLLLKEEGGEVVQEYISITSSDFYVDPKSGIQVGDFSGDGKQDIMVVSRLLYGGPYEVKLYSWDTSTETVVGKDVQSPTYLPMLYFAHSINRIEFDGDGKTDILAVFQNNSIIFSLTNNGTYYEEKLLYQGGFPTKWHENYFGDFNGDGKTDFLTAGDNGAGLFQNWEIAYSTGVGFHTESFVPGSILIHTAVIQNLLNVAWKPMIGDFNGDGMDDIAVGFGSGNPSNYDINGQVELYLSTGVGFNLQVVQNDDYAQGRPQDWHCGDFNGDGKTDVILHSITSSSTAPNIVCHFFKDTKEKLLKRVIGGHGLLTQFNYNFMSQSSNYIKGNEAIFPLMDIQTSLPIIESVTSSLYGQIIENNKYSYDQFRVHRQGAGILGFKEVSVFDELTRFKNTKTMFWDIDLAVSPLADVFYAIEQVETEIVYVVSEEEELYEPMESTTESYHVVITDLSAERYARHLSHVSIFNYINNTKLLEHYQHGANGNLQFKNKIGYIDFPQTNSAETTKTSYYDYVAINGGFLPSLPQEIVVEYQRDNQVPIIESTEIAYNPNGTMLSKATRSGSTYAESTVEYNYGNNPFGLVESVTTSGVKPTDSEVNNGELTFSATEPIAVITTDQYLYSDDGRHILEHTDRYGFTTQYAYYNRWGKPKTITDYQGRQNYFEYDGFGRIKKEVDYLGQAVSTEREFVNATPVYSACDSESDVLYKKTTTLPNDHIAITKYNALGQVRFKQQTGQFEDLYSSVCYDELGREKEKTTPHFNGDVNIKTAVVQYDDYGRVFERNLAPVSSSMVYEPQVDGHLTTLVSNASGTRTSKTDLSGRLVQTTDPGGVLTRTYQSGGLLKKVELNGQQVVENTYDEFGRQIKLDDMNAGSTFYNYDSFDNVIFQQDANGNILETEYDELGRIEARTVSKVGENNGDPLGSYDYEFYDDGPEETLLKKETAPSGHATEYTYDNDQNIESITEIIDGQPYATSFDYDEFGKPTRKEYPSGFAIRYEYDNKDYLKRITSDDGQLIIWEITGGTAQGQVTSYNLGNGLAVTKTYDEHFFPAQSMASNGTETVYSFNYDFDPVTSNLKSRDLHGTEEHFFYDTDGKQLNRLAGTGPDEYTVSETYAFADNGNITEKQGVGDYVYHPEKKNAVTQIDIPELGQNQDLVQFVSYNHFNSASEIKNLDDQLRVNLEYGSDDQRRVAKYWDESGAQDELIKTRLYAGAYEKQTNADLTEIEVHYISAGGQLAAIYVVENGVGSYFYPHQDHLGSIIHITDANGDIVYTQSFDPWGRTRNPNDLTYDNIPTRPDWLWRGYTGHEHLDEFGLINMNGRLYDPVVGRMLSPDNFVQNPDFSQSYNRYSYVWNNPLKFTDPSGEFIHGTLITMVFDFLATVFVHGGIDPTNTSENRNEAWKNFDPSAKWSKTNQALQIDLGRFRTDPNRSTGGQIFQIFNRFTREVPQTELGNTLAHIRNISGSVDNVDNFGGATVVDNSKGDGRWGLTLGPYINTSRIGRVDEFNNLLMHEYGHVLQSETAGDLYLSKVAIPSGLSGLFDYNLGFDHDHDRTWFEISANQRVNRYLDKHYTSKGKPSVKDHWYEEEYPTSMDQIEWNWFVLFNPFIF